MQKSKTLIIKIMFLCFVLTVALPSYGNDDNSELLKAAGKGNNVVIEILLEGRADINTRDKDGFTPLMLAIINCNDQTAKKLIKKGADLNIKNNNGLTSLTLARAYAKKELIELLVKHGAKEAL